MEANTCELQSSVDRMTSRAIESNSTTSSQDRSSSTISHLNSVLAFTGTMQEDLLPDRVPLPDTRGRMDEDGILQRRLTVYNSYIAPSSVMLQLPVSDDPPISVNPQFHHRYYIKTMATTKCDECRQRCKGDSEVYQCRDCAAQICRECVEEGLEKEINDAAGNNWVWRGSYHTPFKLAYLLRRSRDSNSIGRGEWVGTVDISGTTTRVPARIEYPQPKTKGSRPNKASHRHVSEGVVGAKRDAEFEREDQSKHVRNQAMGLGTRRKLDRILNATSSSISKPGKKSSTTQIDRQNISNFVTRLLSHVEQDTLTTPLVARTHTVAPFDGPDDDDNDSVAVTTDSYDNGEGQQEQVRRQAESNIPSHHEERARNVLPSRQTEEANSWSIEEGNVPSIGAVEQASAAEPHIPGNAIQQASTPETTTQPFQDPLEPIQRPRTPPLPYRLERPRTPPFRHIRGPRGVRQAAARSPTPPERPRQSEPAQRRQQRREPQQQRQRQRASQFQIWEDPPILTNPLPNLNTAQPDPTPTRRSPLIPLPTSILPRPPPPAQDTHGSTPDPLPDIRPDPNAIPRQPLSPSRYRYIGVLPDLRARFEGRITTYDTSTSASTTNTTTTDDARPGSPSNYLTQPHRDLLVYALVTIDARTNEWFDIPLTRPVRNFRHLTPAPDGDSDGDSDGVSLMHHRPLPPHSRSRRSREDEEGVTITQQRLRLPEQGPREYPVEYAGRLVRLMEGFLREEREGAGDGDGTEGEEWRIWG